MTLLRFVVGVLLVGVVVFDGFCLWVLYLGVYASSLFV